MQAARHKLLTVAATVAGERKKGECAVGKPKLLSRKFIAQAALRSGAGWGGGGKKKKKKNGGGEKSWLLDKERKKSYKMSSRVRFPIYVVRTGSFDISPPQLFTFGSAHHPPPATNHLLTPFFLTISPPDDFFFLHV